MKRDYDKLLTDFLSQSQSANKTSNYEYNKTGNWQSFNRAKFEANIRRANSVNYSCAIQGHSINGKPFKINTLAFVDDDFCNISSELLIHTIEYRYSLNQGSTSMLQMTYKDAYTLQAQQEARDAARQLVGDDL